MRLYVACTGLLFLLIVAAHVARLFVEGMHVASQPGYWITTSLAVGMLAWAALLLRAPKAKPGT